jgi:hypothetical protein
MYSSRFHTRDQSKDSPFGVKPQDILGDFTPDFEVIFFIDLISLRLRRC